MGKTPNGFRAVRMRGKTEVVYCVEHKVANGLCIVETFTAGGVLKPFTAQAFNATHAREYSPMPDAVRAMFQGKPSFAAWWVARNQEEDAA